MQLLNHFCIPQAAAQSKRGGMVAGGADPERQEVTKIENLFQDGGLKAALVHYLRSIPLDKMNSEVPTQVRVRNILSRVSIERLIDDILIKGNYVPRPECLDVKGKSQPLTANHGDFGGSICYNSTMIRDLLLPLNPEQKLMSLCSMLLHEHLHHLQEKPFSKGRFDELMFEKNEEEAHQLQDYMKGSAAMLPNRNQSVLVWRDRDAVDLNFEFTNPKAICREKKMTSDCNTFEMGATMAELQGVRGLDDSVKKLLQIHPVELTYDFEIQTTPVTQALWHSIVGKNNSYFKFEKFCPGSYLLISGSSLQKNPEANFNIEMCVDHPVESISWLEVQEFLRILNEKHKDSEYIYRLPTAAEWQYSIQGGLSRAERQGWVSILRHNGKEDIFVDPRASWNLPSGERYEDYFWLKDTSNGQTHPVKSCPGRPRFCANEFGIYGSVGNVMQYTSENPRFGTDGLQKNPGLNEDPSKALSKDHVIVVGSSYGISIGPEILPFINRYMPLSHYSEGLGFRLVRQRK